jgi:hypothetical protein
MSGAVLSRSTSPPTPPGAFGRINGQRQGDLLKMRLHKTNGVTPWYDGTHVFLRCGKGDSFIKVRAVRKLKEALDAEVSRAANEPPEQQRKRNGHVLVILMACLGRRTASGLASVKFATSSAFRWRSRA